MITELTAEIILEHVRENKRKIFIGIEPCAPRWFVLSGFNARRLGLTIIKSILEQGGWEVFNHYENIGEPFLVLENPLLSGSNTVVGISTITSTAPRAYKLARKVKQINPRLLVLLGGFHPTACPDEALDYANFVIRGEGEETIKELLCSQRPVEEIKGISYWQGGVKKHNPERPLLASLSYPRPLLDHALCNGPITPVLFGRGCPFRCNFCAVSQVMGPKMRVRPAREVVAELRQLAKQGVRKVFIVDDNLFGDLEKAVKLLRLIVQEGIKLPIYIQMRADIRVSRNPEILSLMRKAGIFLVCVGIESVEDASLKEISKGVSMEHVIEFVTTMRQWHFSIYAMFIFGSLQDRVDSTRKIVTFMLRYLPSEFMQIMFMTPIPGTRFYREIKEQIFDFDWANYDANCVVWQHPHMQPKEQYQAMISAYKAWYSPWNMGRILVQKLLKGHWETILMIPYLTKGIYRTIKEWGKAATMSDVSPFPEEELGKGHDGGVDIGRLRTDAREMA